MTNDIFCAMILAFPDKSLEVFTVLLSRIHNPISNLVNINFVGQINHNVVRVTVGYFDSTNRSSVICKTDTA